MACHDDSDAYEQARQDCVDQINEYRAALGLPALERWTEGEGCTDSEASSDSRTGTPHGAFGQCGEHAQNECPGWGPPVEDAVTGCLKMMWDEGEGGGHYENMTGSYTRVACGFYEGEGGIWAIQNFQ
jgi:hypothetical protein